jgi:hypothetical protein
MLLYPLDLMAEICRMHPADSSQFTGHSIGLPPHDPSAMALGKMPSGYTTNFGAVPLPHPGNVPRKISKRKDGARKGKWTV